MIFGNCSQTISILFAPPEGHSRFHMPTITIFKQDLDGLLAAPGEAPQPITMEQLEELLMLVKGELKGQTPHTGELRIELQDSNRPDLWCCEGIARQLRVKQQGAL